MEIIDLGFLFWGNSKAEIFLEFFSVNLCVCYTYDIGVFKVERKFYSEYNNNYIPSQATCSQVSVLILCSICYLYYKTFSIMRLILYLFYYFYLKA